MTQPGEAAPDVRERLAEVLEGLDRLVELPVAQHARILGDAHTVLRGTLEAPPSGPPATGS